ncbi:MAG: chemotaxis protein CheZ [Proteobacteria bacterium]|jgi:chemotaxis protein CheZ|nr:protein phosphatase CheZ [Alphaproteobacteria bacterium]NCC03422.1 chemotaxis protein CheZ [Pseudomonadota bacterium]
MDHAERINALESNLHQKLSQASKESKNPLSSDEVTKIVKDVISSLTGDITASDLRFYAELEDLANYIFHAKQEIAEIKPKEISSDHIPHATDELDAVVGATEDATNKIMDVCDTISELAGQCPPEIGDQLVACTTHIFEACNFQDITGQRITKVVQTLKYIDTKIAALLKALGEEVHRDGDEGGSAVDYEKSLLNGPQLPQNAINQDEIDKLLSGM